MLREDFINKIEGLGFKKKESVRGGYRWVKDYSIDIFTAVHEDGAVWISYDSKNEQQVADLAVFREYGVIDPQNDIFNPAKKIRS